MIKRFPKLEVIKNMGRTDVEKGYNLSYIHNFEEDKKDYEKRHNTGLRWAAWGYGDNKKDPIVEVHDNTPVKGIFIANSVRRCGYNGGNVVWRVCDPRGWEFEISSANLAALIDEIGISAGGVIEAECVYGRSGGQNIILPLGSSAYEESKKPEEIKKEVVKKVSSKLLKPGMIVKAPAVTTWRDDPVYLGQVKITSKCKLNGKKYYAFANTWKGKVEKDNCIYFFAGDVVTEITGKTMDISGVDPAQCIKNFSGYYKYVANSWDKGTHNQYLYFPRNSSLEIPENGIQNFNNPTSFYTNGRDNYPKGPTPVFSGNINLVAVEKVENI